MITLLKKKKTFNNNQKRTKGVTLEKGTVLLKKDHRSPITNTLLKGSWGKAAKQAGLGLLATRVGILVLLSTSCVILGKSLSLSEPQCLQL